MVMGVMTPTIKRIAACIANASVTKVEPAHRRTARRAHGTVILVSDVIS
jgi:hypothetical protein